jgi:acyl-coenzyme A thioesterase PaaI-like protein
MLLETHLNIETALCGKVTKLEEGYAEVLLHTTQQMIADSQGLVHGGFIFGAADYAAMSAVNDPNVVLGSSNCKFIAPVKVKDVVHFKAKVSISKGKKKVVEVEAFTSDKRIFEGSFTTFVLDGHVLG